MTIQHILDNIGIKPREYFVDIFNRFEFDNQDLAMFYKALLQKKLYNDIVFVVSHSEIGCIKSQDDYKASTSNPYWVFYLYLKNDILKFETMPKEQQAEFYSFAFWAFYAADGEDITLFCPAIKSDFFALAKDDIESFLQLVKKYDTSFRTIDVAFAVNSRKTLDWLAMFYLKDNSINAKKLLTNHIDQLLQYYFDNRDTLCIKHKQKLVRLFGLYKNSTFITNILGELRELETNASITKLIDNIISKDKNSDKLKTEFYKVSPKYTFDENGIAIYNGEFGQAKYTLDDSFELVNLQMPTDIKRKKGYTDFESGLYNSVQSRLKQLEQFMNNYNIVKGQTFLQKISNDWFFAKICECLVFAVVQNNDTVPIFVDKGKVIDIDNNALQISDNYICILHPINFNQYYDIISQQNIIQPFEQIKRKIYFLSNSAKGDKVIKDYCNRIINIQDFVDKSAGVVKFDRDGLFAYYLVGELYCKIDLKPLQNDNFMIIQIAFYKKTDLKNIKNRYSFDGQGLTIGSVDKITYSESIRTIEALL